MSSLIVAVAQTASVLGAVEENAKAAATLVGTAAASGARLIVFPELSLIGYELEQLADPAVWVSDDDVRLDQLRALSAEYGTTVVLGAAYRGEERLLASLVLRPNGRMLVHGKRFLHGRERELFDAGKDALLVDVDGWRVAMSICYEAGVPAHAQEAAACGADVYAGSALYTVEEARRMDVHFAARAMDHRLFALCANHAGDGPGWVSCGASGVWHPDGRRGDHLGSAPGVLVATLDRTELDALRDKDARAGYPR